MSRQLLTIANELYKINHQLQSIIRGVSVPHNMSQEELEAIKEALGRVVDASLEIEPYVESEEE